MFKTGDKVVCINIDGSDGSVDYCIKLNKIYTVRDIYYSSISLIELPSLYGYYRFKTIHEIRLDKINKLKERICLKSVI